MAGKENCVSFKDHTAERGFNELPFTYCDPKRLHIFWICNYDQDGKITSVVVNDKEPKGKNRVIRYLNTLEDAIHMRNEIIKSGWIEFKLPEINVTQPTNLQRVENVPSLNRRQRRALKRISKSK